MSSPISGFRDAESVTPIVDAVQGRLKEMLEGLDKAA